MIEKAKQQALKWVARKARSEQEVRQYLEEAAYTDDIIEEVIAYLYSYQYLDDAALAGMFIRDRIRFHPCGRDKLRYDLSRKGVSDAFIEAALEENFSDEDEHVLATGLYEQQLARGRSAVQAQRYLYSKGFSADAISRVRSD